jgi:uncharacterized protein YndB with AHSA1/START domain
MSYSASASTTITAPREKVWEALTKPEQVKEYFFGTDLDTTWEPNSSIFFSGEWEGKSYEDKGTVISFEPPASLSYTYWSPMSGTPDSPEQYQTLRYDLADTEEGTEVTITQDGSETQEKADHSSGNWKMVLEGLKKYVENKA